MRCPVCEAPVDVLDICEECLRHDSDRNSRRNLGTVPRYGPPPSDYCRRGHELTINETGRRRCIPCAARLQREFRARKRR